MTGYKLIIGYSSNLGHHIHSLTPTPPKECVLFHWAKKAGITMSDNDAGAASSFNFNGLEAESSSETVTTDTPILKLIDSNGKAVQKKFIDIAKASHHRKVLKNLRENDVTPNSLKPRVTITAFKQNDSLEKAISRPSSSGYHGQTY